MSPLVSGISSWRAETNVNKNAMVNMFLYPRELHDLQPAMPGDETQTSNANEEHLEKTFGGSGPVHAAGNTSRERRKDPN